MAEDDGFGGFVAEVAEGFSEEGGVVGGSVGFLVLFKGPGDGFEGGDFFGGADFGEDAGGGLGEGEVGEVGGFGEEKFSVGFVVEGSVLGGDEDGGGDDHFFGEGGEVAVGVVGGFEDFGEKGRVDRLGGLFEGGFVFGVESECDSADEDGEKPGIHGDHGGVEAVAGEGGEG